jgi:cell division protein FtsI (penicillin-binding protein 3)
MSDSRKGIKTTRTAIIILGIIFWSFCILIRLVQLQIFEHESFVQLATQRQQVRRSILAPRGVIYDSHLHELASSVTLSTVIAEPRSINDKPMVARRLAEILELDPQDLLSQMLNPKRQYFLEVKRCIDPQAEKRIEALNLDGVYFVDTSMRVYPNRELACQTLGFVNRDNKGGAGIEQKYDEELQGKEGIYSFEVDAHRRSFRLKVDKAPVQGHSLVLSIDKFIQSIADRHLAAGVEKAHAKSGIAIIMESETGRILALSNYPQFNCNKYNKYKADRWLNRAISDMFEPGSTFKVVVATAALEAGLTRPDEMIDCLNGAITIGRHVFHDHKPYGLLSFSQILEFSSNVGAARLGLRLGEERLYKWLRIFGFGSKTGVDLPGEFAGRVLDWSDWSGLSIGAISFGQEVGVTSIQILTAINAIANGGYRVRPFIVDRIIDEEGNRISVTTPEKTRFMSPQTAEAVSNAFEGVVLRGTGRRAALEGYRAAGKTGTAQKAVNGRYSNTKYVASFIGFAPLPKPRITVLVQIDEPQGGHYGGDVCAPFFQSIAQETLLQLGVPPDPNLPLPATKPLVADLSTEDYLPNAVQPLETTYPSNEEEPGVISILIEKESIKVPDFRGMSKRSVLQQCMDLGIRLQSIGAGVAVSQSPSPGTRMPMSGTCRVTFSKAGFKTQPVAEEHHVAPFLRPLVSANARP